MKEWPMVMKCTFAVASMAIVMWPGVARPAPQSSKTVWDGVYSDDQAKRGRALYNDRCMACHGTEMNGGEMAPPLAGIQFQSNWEGLSVGDLAERIRISMPQGAEGTLSRQQVSDIVSAIFAANAYPVGQTELAVQPDILKAIQITPKK